MNQTIPARIGRTFRRLRMLIAIVSLVYLTCIGGGMATSRGLPERLRAAIAEQETQSEQAVERIFGRYRESVRQGHWGAIATGSGLILLLNLAGDFLQFTLPSILILPACFTLGVGGWLQGLSLAGIHASSKLSLCLFLFVGCLEWMTYVLATVAGVNSGLSVLMPKRQEASTRWLAFKRAWGEAGQLYVVIIGILAMQAVLEMLYVRKVLMMGGSGIPLMPY